MARPMKDSLDYFSHDTNLSNDRKVEYLESEHGLNGYGIFVKLLEKVYGNGYYIKFTKRDVILMSRRTGLSEEEITGIVGTCVKERLFSKELFDKYSVLTSAGVQSRYLKACERRKVVEIIEELNLQGELPSSVISVKIADCRDFVDDDDYKAIKIKVVDDEPKDKKAARRIREPKPEFEAEVHLLFDLFKSTLTNGQEIYLPKTDSDRNKWLEAFDKCKRLDNYDWWQIADIVSITRAEEFWQDKFLTPLKLRTKNKENMKYIDFFWGRYQDKLEEPEGSALDYIEGLIGEAGQE